ncbi:hypothetical protein BC828DRAFT_392152 [Blastocladiella britannica]|nr:hypothetical protein BC828DRAFT_392152 [Blastocladiella britannica]
MSSYVSPRWSPFTVCGAASLLMSASSAVRIASTSACVAASLVPICPLALYTRLMRKDEGVRKKRTYAARWRSACVPEGLRRRPPTTVAGAAGTAILELRTVMIKSWFGIWCVCDLVGSGLEMRWRENNRERGGRGAAFCTRPRLCTSKSVLK